MIAPTATRILLDPGEAQADTYEVHRTTRETPHVEPPAREQPAVDPTYRYHVEALERDIASGLLFSTGHKTRGD